MAILKPVTYATPELAISTDGTAFVVSVKNNTVPLEICVDRESAHDADGRSYLVGPVEGLRIPVSPGVHYLSLYGGGKFYPTKEGYKGVFPEPASAAAPEPSHEPEETVPIKKATMRDLIDELRAIADALEAEAGQ